MSQAKSCQISAAKSRETRLRQAAVVFLMFLVAGPELSGAVRLTSSVPVEDNTNHIPVQDVLDHWRSSLDGARKAAKAASKIRVPNLNNWSFRPMQSLLQRMTKIPCAPGTKLDKLMKVIPAATLITSGDAISRNIQGESFDAGRCATKATLTATLFYVFFNPYYAWLGNISQCKYMAPVLAAFPKRLQWKDNLLTKVAIDNVFTTPLVFLPGFDVPMDMYEGKSIGAAVEHFLTSWTSHASMGLVWNGLGQFVNFGYIQPVNRPGFVGFLEFGFQVLLGLMVVSSKANEGVQALGEPNGTAAVDTKGMVYHLLGSEIPALEETLIKHLEFIDSQQLDRIMASHISFIGADGENTDEIEVESFMGWEVLLRLYERVKDSADTSGRLLLSSWGLLLNDLFPKKQQNLDEVDQKVLEELYERSTFE